MIEKVRPVLILSIPFADADRALVTVVFHTTAVRNSQFEVKIEVPFLVVAALLWSAPDASHREAATAEIATSENNPSASRAAIANDLKK
jgi:hypothetical protein